MSSISEVDRKFLDRIWDVYGKYTGIQLSNMTHQENTPWDTVWNKQDGKNQKDAIIPNETIKTYYDSLRYKQPA